MLKFARVGLTMGLVAAALVLVLRQTDSGALARSIAELPTAVILWMTALMLAGAFLASMRLAAIAADVGHPLHFREAVAALSIGQLAGSLFFQLVGQLVARSALLGRHGLPVSATVVMTAYERLIALAVSLSLALAGGWYIFGRLALDLKAGGAEFAKLAITAFAVLIAGAAFVWGKAFIAAMAPRFGSHVAYRLSRTATLSTATQLCTMAAYVIGANALEPVIPLSDVAAASAVVMLAASLPISLAGWGVREVSAVLALGAIGMPAEEAFVVAAAVGIVSMAAVALLSACTASSWRGSANAHPGSSTAAAAIDYGAFLSWILPLGAATAVFFQVYAPTGQGGRININFADPAAIVGGSLFLVWAIRDRRWPSWRLPGFNVHVVAATATIAVAFLSGWASFGLTDWALTNRLLGWFVLLGYGATGALIVFRAGTAGYETLLRTLVLSGVVVALVDLALLVFKLGGLNLGLVEARISGFAMNPNAFAFQLCMCFAAALIVFRDRMLLGVLAVILAALWCTGSRAGLGTIAILALAAMWLRPSLCYPIITAVVIAACVTLVLTNLPLISSWTKPVATASSMKATIDSALGDSEASNAERLLTLQRGLELFLGHPIFGAGLGAFANGFLHDYGRIQVIHSTPLWLLAEFGVTGTAIMMLPIVRAFRREWPLGGTGDIGFLLILVILGFVVMSSVHELLYQRVFWLLLGASLAMVGMDKLRNDSREAGPRSPTWPPQG